MGAISRLFLSVGLIFAFGACSPSRDASVDGPLESAYRKIDRREYDAAIQELESELNRRPHPRVREALASAYAARAGIFIQNYWGFLVGFRAPLVNVDRIETSPNVQQARKILSQLDGQPDIKGDQAFARLARFFGALHLWSERMEHLPTVRDGARKDVTRAVEVLRDHPHRGGRLYRALLGLVVFKSDLVVGFTEWTEVEAKLRELDLRNPGALKNKVILCDIDIKNFARWAGGVVGRLNATAEDIAVAYPSKREEIEGALEQSSNVSRELKKAGEGGCF